MLAESSSSLAVQDVVCGGEHRLVLSGELDVASAPRLESIARQICRGKLQRLVVDLRKLTFLDSAGLGVIVALSERCMKNGQELGLIPGQGQVQRIFALSGVDRLPFVRPGG